MEKYAELPAGHPEKDRALDEWKLKASKNVWGNYTSAYSRTNETSNKSWSGFGTKFL